MIRSHTCSIADWAAFRRLFLRACRGGLAFWSIAVGIAILMASLDWPIRLIEGLFVIAVWAPAIALAPLFLIVPGSLLEQWGWVVGALLWLPLAIAFRFAHLCSIRFAQ